MRTNKLFFAVGLVLTAFLFAEVATHASDADQAMKITFSAPVQIPSKVLPAGTYLFKLMSPDNPNLVQIFSADRTRLYATLQTIPIERLEPTGDTAIALAEPGSQEPALLGWFFPGDLEGHQLVYSKNVEQQLAQSRQQTIAAKDTAEAGD
jgi:hypothetical protein